MKKFIPTNVVALLAVVVIALAGILFITKSDRTGWVDFPAVQGQDLTPQVVTVVERDYGWRTADVVPIVLYIKQLPGTRVDMHSLAIEGDFDVVGNPDIVSRDFKDGSKYIRIRLNIQSMKVDKRLSIKMSMLWRDIKEGDDRPLAIPAFQPFTSPTWDGRDIIQDGDPQYWHGTMLIWTLSYLVVGVFGAFFLNRLRKRWIEEEEVEKKRGWDSRRAIARKEFDLAWARFDNGDFSVESYKAVAKCVRKLFRLESKVMREIEMELGSAHPYRVQTLKILELCGKVMYANRSLKEDEHYSIRDTFNEIVPPLPAETTEVDGEGDDVVGDLSD